MRDGADGLDEQETQQYRSLVGTALYVGQDKPETQYATKEAARLMSGPTRAAKCMLKRLCKHYSVAPVLSWSFPYQEMPSEIRAVTDANWAGELEGLRSTSCGWTYFGVIICWRRIHRRSRLWRCQLQRVSTSRSQRVQLTLWRSAVLCWKYGMTFNVVCETDASAGRAVVWAACLTWMRDCCSCSSCAQKAWFKFEPGLESATRQTWEQRCSI